MGKSSQNNLVAQKIAARVAERDSWSTWHTATPSEVFGMLRKLGFSKSPIPPPAELDKTFPVQTLDWELIKTMPPQKMAVTWIGHATCLVQLDGFNILTDPIFSKRCAPTQFAGPARYRPTPCSIPELLEQVTLDVVAISHNHYDHLDYNSIKALVQHAPNPLVFVVPLGLKSWLQSNISKIEEKHQIIELDWHESHTLNKNENGNSLEVMPVPMQHWGSRAGFDRDTTLWCGFSLKSSSKNQSALFCGDTGWFEEVKEIGDKYGPYDLAMIPIGAYDPYDFMRPQHNNPEDAVKMFNALQVKTRAVPIHWGTFQLTREPIMEPRERLVACLEKEGIDKNKFAPWLIGETVVLDPSV
ncbi:unnamed protein product [Cylindrotheca closterium]|uniref:Metallo-beta-lactamase domain-containing protein n=1 Tax=Cylindrotheca closterium TaxID=2856 RepID=A0AAD2FPI4_9STRA|nr:unnamed protein product [Cylindrotheca closterium]